MAEPNFPQSPISLDLTTYIPPQSQVQRISTNWNIPTSTSDAILPSSLHPTCWTTPLLEAVQDLSLLTIGQKDRAYSLLSTYFQARIREASYMGKQGNIYAKLEVADVQEAIASVKRMRKGLEMQGKRKYSIREEIVEDDTFIAKSRPTKTQKTSEVTEMIPNTSSTLTANTTSEMLSNAVSCNQPLFSDVQTLSQSPPSTRKRLSLPPINTQPFAPQHVSLSSYTTPQHLTQEAQRATHEFNVRRIELEQLEMNYIRANQNYADAMGRMEWAKAQVEIWRESREC